MARLLTPLEIEMAAAFERCANLIQHLLDMNGPNDFTGRLDSQDDPTLEIVRALLAKAEASNA